MKKDLKTISAIHIGVSGFPYGSAPINRCFFVYKSLVENGIDFLYINNKAVHNKGIPLKLERKGIYKGVNYIYTPPDQYKSNSFVKKRISNILGILNEIILIIKLKFTNRLDIAFYYPDGKLSKLFYYRFLSLMLNFPIISHYVEYRSAFEARKKSKILRFTDSFFDRRFTCFVDASLPISEFLIEKLKESKCRKPYLKIPPLTDFNLFSRDFYKTQNKYFLYCGSAGYSDAYKFVISSFEKMNNKGFLLNLIINGSSSQIKTLLEIISKSSKSEYIIHYQNLKYEELIEQYCNASALLIPLTASIRDKARFPQKISEYLAAGNPVVTTNFGEIRYYFKNFENALISYNYDTDEYAKLLDFIVDEPDRAKAIGKKGIEIGKSYFHYQNYGDKIINLINSLLQR